MASAVRRAGAALVVEGAPVREVCAFVDEEIGRRGAAPAFPTQSSRNHIAAHYCPSPEDDTRYARGDLAKLDIGVHVDGWVVDTALTVNVGDLPENRRVVAAAEAALHAAIAAAGPHVLVQRMSEAIESAVLSFGLRTLRNLCGHGVGRYVVHCPPAIPNVPLDRITRLPPGSTVAIEPFATTGLGAIVEEGSPEVFRLDPRREAEAGPGPVAEALRAFRGLPFARRQLGSLPRPEVEAVLAELLARGVVSGYAPLVQADGHKVAQAEHTIHVSERGVEVLTA